MSPTAAIVSLISALYSPAAAGTGAVSEIISILSSSDCGGSLSGAVAHAETNKTAGRRRITVLVGSLVAKSDSQHINLRLPEAASEHVQLIEIVNRADSDPVVGLVVDRYALNL